MCSFTIIEEELYKLDFKKEKNHNHISIYVTEADGRFRKK